MDQRYLPEIFALAIFVGGFRPLVRRVGAHVDLWFLGWGFLLLHYVALTFAAPHGWRHAASTLLALWATELCALCFVVATANMPTPQVGWVRALELVVPVLLQSGTLVFYPDRPGLQLAALSLFLVPGVHLLARPKHRSRPLVTLGLVFAVFAVSMIPVAQRRPQLVAQGALAVLFLTAAFLYAMASKQRSRGAFAAVAGLAGWGVSYPFAAAWLHFHGGTIARGLLECPQCLVIAGIILSLLEEHVLRTERMAMHDPLTDLPNRRLFEERLVHTMAEARENRTTVACLVIDVDNFKHINDTLGHSAGDHLLRSLAVRLAWHMSPRDILARTGGDEFTALLAGVHDENHLRFIASAMMSAASVPIAFEGKSVDVRISVGIALSPDHADDIDELRRMADEAMYSAKRRGGSLLAFAGEEVVEPTSAR